MGKKRKEKGDTVRERAREESGGCDEGNFSYNTEK